MSTFSCFFIFLLKKDETKPKTCRNRIYFQRKEINNNKSLVEVCILKLNVFFKEMLRQNHFKFLTTRLSTCIENLESTV